MNSLSKEFLIKEYLENKRSFSSIAKQLGTMIEQNLGMKVIYTRREDVFVPLWKRTQIANNSGGDIFISIHANSTSKSSKIKGFETFLYGSEKSS